MLKPVMQHYTDEHTFTDQPELNYSIKTRNIDGYITVAVPPSEYITTVTVKPFGWLTTTRYLSVLMIFMLFTIKTLPTVRFKSTILRLPALFNRWNL